MWKENGYHAGATHCTTNEGAWCEFKFTGDSISWFCKKTVNRGIAEIHVDGKLDATVDCYDALNKTMMEVYARRDLPPGPHTLRLVVTGKKNRDSQGVMVDVDAFGLAKQPDRLSQVLVSANGAKPFILDLPNDGRGGNTSAVECKLDLRQGENTVRFFHDQLDVPAIDKITIQGKAPLIRSSVVFAGTDTATKGNWTDKYGNEAYSLFGVAAKIPSSLALRYTHGEWQYYATQGGGAAGLGMKTMEAVTADVRGLLQPGSDKRTAACIFRNNSFTLDVDSRDDTTRRLAFYLVDWDKTPRTLAIEAYDGQTNTRIESRTINNSVDGQYVIYKVSGHVKFKFIRTAGPDVTLHGLFMDPCR